MRIRTVGAIERKVWFKWYTVGEPIVTTTKLINCTWAYVLELVITKCTLDESLWLLEIWCPYCIANQSPEVCPRIASMALIKSDTFAYDVPVLIRNQDLNYRG